MKVYRSGHFGLGSVRGSAGTPAKRSAKRVSAKKVEKSHRGPLFEGRADSRRGKCERDGLKSYKPEKYRSYRHENPKKPKKAKGSGRRNRGLSTLLSVLMVLAGVGVIGYTLFGSGSALAGVAGLGHTAAPANSAMSLTVPAMSRVDEDPVYTGAASDSALLNKGAMHLQGTGMPWDSQANVYIAGHRLGYAGTGSFMQFYDLNKLQNGDEIILTDSDGTKYIYTVFRKFTTTPQDSSVTQPLPGRNIVTLQTCTPLLDYSERLIVQGELTSVA